MRKNQRWLMLLITIIVIVAFVFLYNKTDIDKLGQTSVGTIYGKPISGTEFARDERLFDIARGLGMFELLQGLVSERSRNQVEDYVWNTLVLRRQAEILQIIPSEQAVADRIKTLSPFQTDGQFDLEKYNNFVANALTPRGFSQAQLEDLVRDDLRLSKMRDLLGASGVVAEDEVRDFYGMLIRKRHLQVVKLKHDAFTAEATVTPEEVKASFEKNKLAYQTEEKRSVKYTVLQLSDAEKKLTGKERVAALQPISDKADAFSQRLAKAGADFEAIAKELGIEIKTTDTFTQSAPPPEVASVQQFAPAAFSLSKDVPDSDVLQTENAFYILHLDKIEAAQPETLEQATPKITTQLREEKIAAALQKRGAELQKTLRASLKSGQTFAQAAQAAGSTAEAIPPFSPAEQQQSQEMSPDRAIQMSASALSEGAISDLIPTPEGGAIAFVEKIGPLDDAKWKADKETMVDRYSSQKREIGFAEWFRSQRAAANIHLGRSEG